MKTTFFANVFRITSLQFTSTNDIRVAMPFKSLPALKSCIFCTPCKHLTYSKRKRTVFLYFSGVWIWKIKQKEPVSADS